MFLKVGKFFFSLLQILFVLKQVSDIIYLRNFSKFFKFFLFSCQLSFHSFLFFVYLFIFLFLLRPRSTVLFHLQPSFFLFSFSSHFFFVAKYLLHCLLIFVVFKLRLYLIFHSYRHIFFAHLAQISFQLFDFLLQTGNTFFRIKLR